MPGPELVESVHCAGQLGTVVTICSASAAWQTLHGAVNNIACKNNLNTVQSEYDLSCTGILRRTVAPRYRGENMADVWLSRQQQGADANVTQHLHTWTVIGEARPHPVQGRGHTIWPAEFTRRESGGWGCEYGWRLACQGWLAYREFAEFNTFGI